jgi:hypothetical protein
MFLDETNSLCSDGILWKHTDFRPGGRSHSVRSRRLVISMVCTVANYEYAWYYYFGQDGMRYVYSLVCTPKRDSQVQSHFRSA